MLEVKPVGPPEAKREGARRHRPRLDQPQVLGRSTAERVAVVGATDREGAGERRSTHRELVFLGVPLVRLSTTRTVRCELCADPLGALEDDERDAIDRELQPVE